MCNHMPYLCNWSAAASGRAAAVRMDGAGAGQSARNRVSPFDVFGFLTASVRQGIEQDALFHMGGQFLRELDRVGVDGHAVDTALDQEFAEFRINGRCLAADGDGLAVQMADTVSLSRSQPRTSMVRSLEPME